MGTNPGAPSFIEENDIKTGLKKTELKKISGELPFLLKLLAVEKPLSIQVHPGKKQALEGFKIENKNKINLDSPQRNYKDKNSKCEILCALTPFTLMAGFRKPEEILASFSRASDEQNALIQKLKNIYPNDRAVYAPLYLNIVSLKPGQAVYLPAGIPHSYISGLGIELMDNSDNVLRGGLTPKHIDINELNRIVNIEPFYPDIMTPGSEVLHNFNVPADFSLSIVRGKGKNIKFCAEKPSICAVTEGELKINDLIFKKNESFFIQCKNKNAIIELNGNFTMFSAKQNLKNNKRAVV